MTQSGNGRGSPTGWAGTWGPLTDGRSRLARRARQHADAELLELGVTAPTPLQRRRAQRLGELLALVDMVAAGIGTDAKSTPRKVTALLRSAQMERRGLRALAATNGHAPLDLAEQFAQAHRTREGAGG